MDTPPIIDCHVHLYAPEVARDPSGWGEARGENGWIACVAPQGRRSLQGWADVDRLLADMDAAGVARSVLLGWYWEKQDTCDEQNAWYLEWVRRHPDRLSAFAAVQPAAGKRAIEQAERMLDAGFIGFGEMLPQAQHYGYDDPWWHALLELAASRGVPVNLHVTDAVVVPTHAAPRTPLEEVVDLVRQFPDVKFVLAHMGGGLPFHETNPRVRAALRGCRYDTAAVPLLYEPRVYRAVVDLVGAERLLWGTDYPLLTHPRDTREPDLMRSLAEARAALASELERRLVLGGNIATLCGIPTSS
ncbi:hypothetical protein ASA1KI_13180 [Opitutales bacterium ASA1]|uniref:amidohydrolase family protein n=1 Tax=Congregicoccus parvus TaxID=3081749 RepID=UPI002B324788|nr:hypothetical protein ASA1KI_13180 [Opitutales bacterium ASA1]